VIFGIDFVYFKIKFCKMLISVRSIGFKKRIFFLFIFIIVSIPSWTQTTNQTNKPKTNQTTTSKTNNQTTKQTTVNPTNNQTTKQNTVNPTNKQAPNNQNSKQTTNQTTSDPNTTNQPNANQSAGKDTQKETQKVQEERVDTIILVSGKKLLGKVNGVLTSKVTYFPLGKTKIEDLARKQIQLIRYSTGRVEKFNKPAYEMVAEGDFKTIILTDKPDEVSGLFKLGKVNAQSSKAARNAKAAEESANIRLQKKAANMGAYIVLITRRESKGGYGEVPTHFVEGIAYGLEAPKEQPTPKK
jgi:hypothetical protein